MVIAMNNGVSNFIATLGLPKIAEGVLKTTDDCQSFYIGYFGRNKYVANDLLDYRDHKIKNSNITLDLFLDMCYTNISKAFEDTFVQSFSDIHMELIEDALFKGRTTLEELYVKFHKNTDRNIMKNIL
jgi:hypothetical protein